MAESIMHRGAVAAAAVLVVLAALRPSAQILNTQAPVVVGHYHLNVTSAAEHERFWVDTLGGTPVTIAGARAVRFPDVFIMLREQKPTGPARGTAFDHIGFAVPDVPALTAKVVAGGYQLTVGREPAPGQTVSLPTAGNYGKFSYLLGPDGVKVELVTAAGATAPPIAHHHVHFINKQYVEMQQWYMKAFNATLRPGQTDFFIGADLPGVGYMLNFFRWEGDQSITHAATAGRVVDHVGFEVAGLEEFCRQLEAKGIRLAQPYRKSGAGIASAFLTDPWGVSIELTEGLRAVP